MPLRYDFLKSGLVPYTVPPECEDDCAICGSAYSNASKLPCGHVFDYDCIKKWLSMKGRNTCPMCKTVLFSLPEDEDRNFGQDRREFVVTALRRSGLNEGDVLTSIEKFDCSPPSIPALQRATAHASQFLAHDPRTNDAASMSGPVIVRTQDLLASFIAMGNLIPALAIAQGREYGRQDATDWKLVLGRLWHILKSLDGKKLDALVMPVKLRKEVKKLLEGCYSDAAAISFLFVYADLSHSNPRYDDLQLLLNYLTMRCWMMQRDEEASEARRKDEKAKKREERRESKIVGKVMALLR
jgi:hypothetical protein